MELVHEGEPANHYESIVVGAAHVAISSALTMAAECLGNYEEVTGESGEGLSAQIAAMKKRNGF